ncbi:RluA family pseudouridine synthase [Candidatus Falkowbacteria bacterium]|nr:RluA family pseudouridine synthase [Candidatus Falkowbacteria bacterium]NCT55204.1 RluA family pseudouridine synthase [Candidatus Falkowbacteria bacterium]
MTKDKDKQIEDKDLSIVKDPIIIFEDENYLVIDKPAGLAVHPGGNIVGATLKDWLLDYYPAIKTVGEDEDRPGIMHRLDMDVSGLMVVAKNQKSYESLKKQFQDRKVIKKYIALVHGQVSKDEDIIDFSIKRSKDGYKMAAQPKNTENLLTRHSPKNRDQGNLDGFFKSKASITKFSVLKRFVNYSLVDIKIETGRTHQIRVHFYAYGHPLAGDHLYFTKKTKVKNEKLNLGRVFLFAKKLSFKNLEGKLLDFNLEMPKDLENKLPKN